MVNSEFFSQIVRNSSFSNTTEFAETEMNFKNKKKLRKHIQ